MRWPPGSCPSVEESSAVIFKAILDAAPTSAVRLNPDVPAELERIINKALEKDRNLRYQHAANGFATAEAGLRDRTPACGKLRHGSGTAPSLRRNARIQLGGHP